MKKRALIKDIIRDIKKSKGRFLSIVAIVALGVGFFTGLKISPEDMKFTADKYYDDYNLMDIRLVSTLGLTDEDIKEIQKIENIANVFPTYTIDVLANYQEQETVFRVHSFSKDNHINGVNLVEGRYPEKEDEALIEVGNNGLLNIPIGSKIELSSGKEESIDESLKISEYTIVGLVESPYYLSVDRTNSTVGNGQVKNFIMIPAENFKLDVYTDIYLTARDTKELNSYEDEYFDKIKPVVDDLKVLASIREKIRYDEIYNDAMAELNDGKKEYTDAKLEVEEELNKALKEIEDAKEEIKSGESTLIKEEKDFYKKLEEGKKQLNDAEIELENGEKEYNEGLALFNNQKALSEIEFVKAEEQLSQAESSIALMENNIEQINLALSNPQLPEIEKENLNIQLQTLIETLNSTKEALEKGRQEIESNKLKLAMAEEELEKNKELLIKSRETLEEEKNKLVEGEKEALDKFKDAKEDIEKGKIELADGEKKYNEAKAEAEIELNKALKEIEDAEIEIKKIEKAKWYILDRKSHMSYMSYGGAADRIDALAKVFPLFFALVAALVCLTTMTRMVDEQRTNIGTLKALGYNKSDIVLKYIVYALTATMIGCIVGILIGYTAFPIIIFTAYGMMYTLPKLEMTFNFVLAFLTTIVSVGLITMTSYFAASNELKEVPSSLMRPKAPKMGKRILLERIPFIWNRFSFSYKVTVRNIFRYKRRFFMTVLGIAGCTALVLTSFGIEDSLKAIIDVQYGELIKYDINIALEENGDKHLIENPYMENYILVFKESGKLSANDLEKDINVIVSNDSNSLKEFIKLRDRKTKTELSLNDNGVIVTEQMSKMLNVKAGDKIILKNSDDIEGEFIISAIAENYALNYIYISAKNYQDTFNKTLEYNEAIGFVNGDKELLKDEITEYFTPIDEISSVNFNDTVKNSFQDVISGLDYVVLVIIGSAGALAFVVLYNLTNVNISERIREIATIKVLGFYDGEVSAYIYRENVILTVIGSLVGLFMGVYLHRFIMTTVEMDNIMFGLELDMKSYIISVLITLLFSVLVNFAMHYKLKNIKMVESLKSVD